MRRSAIGEPNFPNARQPDIVAYANGIHGWPRVRDSFAQAFRPLQSIDGFASARARDLARLENPSALYRGADGVPDRLERNHAIGNSVSPAVAEWIAHRILDAESRAA